MRCSQFRRPYAERPASSSSNAALVHVLVRVDEAGVRLDVHDDGDPAASAAPGYGLTGMRERAALLGGSCEAGPAPDRGWTVSALLPRAGWSA